MLPNEITAYLLANVTGITATNFFQGLLPATPDDASAIYEYGGEPPVHVKGQMEPVLEKPRFQIITRSKSYTSARVRIETIYRALTGKKGTLSGTPYAQIRALQTPFFLDRDDSARWRFVCNFEVRKGRSPLP